MDLVDLSDEFRPSSFKVFRSAIDAGGVVKAINAKGFAGITIGQADELTEIAKKFGAKGLDFIKLENGEWKSPIVKFFSETEKAALRSKLQIEEGDCIFFGADRWEIASEVLGRIRLRVCAVQHLIVRAGPLDRKMKICRYLNQIDFRKFGPRLTTLFSMVLRSPAGACEFTSRNSRRKCSRCSASARKIDTYSSAICCGRCDSARRHTAASRSVWIGSSC